MNNPYEDYKVYGPYLSSSEARRFIVLVHKTNGTRTGTSYARYLMSMHLGELVPDHLVVDHKDDNQLNDVIENLQVVTKSYNNGKRGRTYVELVCPVCGLDFKVEKRQIKPHQKSPRTCSWDCRAKSLTKAWKDCHQ